MNIQVKPLSFLVLLISLIGISSFVYAARIQVNPVHIYLNSNQRIATIKLGNYDDVSAGFETQVKKWAQRDGKNQYINSNDFIVTPPIFQIASNAKQIVRIGLKSIKPTKVEQAYRLYFIQMPILKTPKAKNAFNLRLMMHISVPVFVLPNVPVKHRLVWRAKWLGAHRLSLVAENDGNVHVQVTKLMLPKKEKSTFVYILPHQTHRWVLDVPKLSVKKHRLSLSAKTNWGAIKEKLKL